MNANFDEPNEVSSVNGQLERAAFWRLKSLNSATYETVVLRESVTELGTEIHIGTPSRPPPGHLAFVSLEPSTHTVTPGGPTAPVSPRAPAPRVRGERRLAVLALLASIGALLTITGVDDRPPPVESVSRSAHANAQVRTVDAGAAQRWFSPAVTVVIDDSVLEMGPEAKQAVIQAFGTWLSSGSKLPELSIETGHGIHPQLDPDGVNTVIYAPIEFSGHEDDLAITIGFSDEQTGEITEADIIINSRHDYASLPANVPGAPTSSCDGTANGNVCGHRYDLQNVMTHEVGHFYGLGEDRDDRKATMYSCTSACETHKRELSESDKGVMNTLYEAGFEDAANTAAGCTAAQLAPHEGLWGWSSAFLVPLVALRRRRSRSGKR